MSVLRVKQEFSYHCSCSNICAAIIRVLTGERTGSRFVADCPPTEHWHFMHLCILTINPSATEGLAWS